MVNSDYAYADSKLDVSLTVDRIPARYPRRGYRRLLASRFPGLPRDTANRSAWVYRQRKS